MTEASVNPTVEPITHQISVKGKMRAAQALKNDDHVIVFSGTILRVARIFVAYWM